MANLESSPATHLLCESLAPLSFSWHAFSYSSPLCSLLWPSKNRNVPLLSVLMISWETKFNVSERVLVKKELLHVTVKLESSLIQVFSTTRMYPYLEKASVIASPHRTQYTPHWHSCNATGKLDGLGSRSVDTMGRCSVIEIACWK